MDEQEKTTHDPNTTDDMIPVNVRENIRASMRQAREDAEANEELSSDINRMVAAQQARLDGDDISSITAHEQRQTWLAPNTARRRLRRPPPENLSDNERSWAMLAHASALLTVLIGLGSAGTGALLTIFIPLGIYLYYREQSDYVAHHALQAFAVQIVGVIGFVALLMSVLIVWTVLFIIAAILSAVLIGIPLLIVLLIAAPFLLLGTLALPLGMLVYSTIAAVEAWGGRFYSYPWIGDWVDNQIYDEASQV